jgi:hypothetical protein
VRSVDRQCECSHTILTSAFPQRTAIVPFLTVRTAMGGPDAPLAVEESVAGLADVIEASRR